MGRILIVEDEVDLAHLYRRVLEREGHEILGVFDDPREALAPSSIDSSTSQLPDVIVVDERLRGLSGLAFLPRFRSVFPAARIILATADPDAASRAVSCGADSSLRKPFKLQSLVERVAAILEGPVPSQPPPMNGKSE